LKTLTLKTHARKDLYPEIFHFLKCFPDLRYAIPNSIFYFIWHLCGSVTRFQVIVFKKWVGEVSGAISINRRFVFTSTIQ